MFWTPAPGSDQLKKDLEDYFGTAMFSGNPMAVMDLQRVQNASPEELRRIAIQNGFDPNKYNG